MIFFGLNSKCIIYSNRIVSEQIPLIPPELTPTLGDGEWVVIADDEASPVRRVGGGGTES